jgi:uncharacterized protein (TIGR00369 family)
MYLAAPINELYKPTIRIADGQATIEFDAHERFFHSAGALHGSVYFKALDDSAFFAAASRVQEVFVLTTSFTIELTRPVTGGRLRAEGRLTSQEDRVLEAESVLFNGDQEVARGRGTFVPSRIELTSALGYGVPPRKTG